MSVHILILQIGLGSLGLLHLLYYDRIVRGVYTSKRSFWNILGRPNGFFWSPPETSWWALSAAMARGWLWWTLLRRPPVWLQADGRARRELGIFRGSYLAAWIFFVAWVGIGILGGWS